MKNVLSLFSMLAIGLASFAQTVNVTFEVNMANEVVAESGVYLAGGVDFGNPGDHPMLDDDGDGVFVITMPVAVGYTGNYTFTNGNCGDWSCKEYIGGQDCADGPWDDRLLSDIQEDTTISTCFSECTTDGSCSVVEPPTTETVTFNMDMSNSDFPNADYDNVVINGSWNAWGAWGITLADEDGDGIWSGSAEFDQNSQIEFVIALTGPADGWGGWGFVYNASGLPCALPNTNNYYVAVGDMPKSVTLCPGTCDATCSVLLDDISLTWQVDMNEEGANPAGVFIAGGFQGWGAGATQMTDDDDDGVYTYTEMVTPGTTVDWKFMNGPAWGSEESVPSACATPEYGNRFVVVPGEDTVLDAVCFGACEGCDVEVVEYPVTFMVNMENEDVAESGVYLAGGGNFGNPGDNQMTDDDGDGIYSITMMLAEGFASYYAFTNGACGDWSCKENLAGQECGDPANFNDRYLPAVAGETTVMTCFGQCSTDGSCTSVSAANVTFQVDMTTSGVNGVVSIFGASINGWDTGATPMSDDDADGIYEITLEMQAGSHEFKYVNNGVDESLDPVEDAECTLTSGAYTNRLIAVVGGEDMILDVVCFESCSACEINSGDVYGCMDSAASNYNEAANVDDGSCLYSTTFNVDMSCAGVEFTTVYVTGPWCGWCGSEDYNFLSDDDGDGIHSLTIDLSGSVEYKYMVDGWAHQEDLIDDMANGGDCAPVTDYASYANRLTDAGLTNDDSYGTCSACPTAILGCMDPFFAEFDMYATEDDGSCATAIEFGCIYDEAENFSADANTDDGSCIFAEAACPGDLDGDGLVATPDLLGFLSVFGTECD